MAAGPTYVTLTRPSCEKAAGRLLAELHGRGYAFVKHPALTPAFLSDVKKAGRAVLTDTSAATRSMCATPCGFRGCYQYVGSSGTGDEIRCFSIGRSVDDPLELRAPYYAKVGWSADELRNSHVARQNHWPEDVDAAAKATLLEYYRVCAESVVPTILDHVALGLQDANPVTALWTADQRSVWAAAHDRRDFNLEAKLYPATAAAAGSVQKRTKPPARKMLRGATASLPPSMPATAVAPAPHPTPVTVERLSTHQDLSSVTLLIQDAMGGLEVVDGETGEFVPVPVLDDAVLVNAGIFLERWTGGRLVATPHRVRNATAEANSRDRCSVVLFAFPDFDAPIRSFFDEGGPVCLAGDLQPMP
jgi:isopenicillin N synthase-like dioxygenase